MTAIDKHAPGDVDWVDLMTSDVEDARGFYGQLFDWSFDVGGPESGNYTMARRGDRMIAGMGQKPPDAPFRTAWTVYYTSTDVDATCAKIKDAGGGVMMPPMDVFDAGRMAICTEPTGGVFGLWQPGQHGGFQLMAEPGAFVWCELNTRDRDRAAELLATVFGYDREPMKDMAYTVLSLGGQHVGGVLQMDEHWPKEVPPHWMTYFQVADTDATAGRARELGGKTCVPPFDTPYGRIAVLEDPQGGLFSVLQPPKT